MQLNKKTSGLFAGAVGAIAAFVLGQYFPGWVVVVIIIVCVGAVALILSERESRLAEAREREAQRHHELLEAIEASGQRIVDAIIREIRDPKPPWKIDDTILDDDYSRARMEEWIKRRLGQSE